MNLKQTTISNGLSKLFAFLQKPVPLPSLGKKKKRKHTHYHYSHKRAQVAKPVASREPRHAVHMYATTPEKEEKEKEFVQETVMPEPVTEQPVTMSTEEEESAEPMEMAPASEEVVESAPIVETQPVAPSLGTILMPTKEEKKTKEEIARTEAVLTHEDGWMQKVLSKKTVDHSLGKWSAWSLLKERLFQPVALPSLFGRKAEPEKVAPAAPALTKEEMANDSFLQRVQKKNVAAPVGTQVDIPEEQHAEPASTLASFASSAAPVAAPATVTAPTTQSRILPPLERKKDEPQPVRKEEVAVAPVPEQKAEEKSLALRQAQGDMARDDKQTPPPKIVIQKRSSAFSNYIASLNYMGLGKERMLFTQNMATMLNAGLPLIDALRTILLETRNKAMKKMVQTILASVENGSSFWRAMDDRHFFSLHAIALVRIGEEAGSLAENMEYLSQQEEKDHELKGKVKMAMIYPSIVMTIMFVLVIILGMFVLPNLIGVLYSLNVDLPLVTRGVIAFTNFFTNYGTIAIPGFIVGTMVLVVLGKVTRLKNVFQWIMFRIPGIGALAREATIARFGVILGGLLKAGVPVIEAVQSLIEVTPIVAYRNLYIKMLEHITIGDSFSRSFQSIKGSEKLLPPSVQQLVVTGEKSGSLADIMLKVADIYDKKASETAQKLPVVLEPIILLFIGALVGTIAFAIIVPIYSIVGSVGR